MGEPLVEVGQVVRRVLRARCADDHLVEDLTQETIVRVAAARDRVPPDALTPYAITTAKHLLASDGRQRAVQRRHAHRLVEHHPHDGPERRALEREETDALAAALERLDEEDRQLLVRHEVDEVDLTTLAAERGTSTGAVAMRLARARADLRLEFLLSFRQVELPTARCRSVLTALSSGDRRRQRALGATEHLHTCPTCASLAPPVAERDRRIAAVLLLPLGLGLRRAWQAVRDHPVVTGAAGVAGAVAITLFVMAMGDRGDEPSAAPVTTPAPSTTAAPPTTAAPATTVPVTVPATAPPAAPATQCPAAVPFDQLDPATAIGCPVAPTFVTVTEVPVDEGFWVQASSGPPMWIQLVGAGESPVDVAPGQQLSVVGTITAPPGSPLPYQLEVAYPALQPG